MSDKTIQLGITADASGVEAGVGKAKRSLASIGATAQQVGEQASKGLDKVGQGGQQASQKIDAATRSLIGQLQRTSAALQAGGRNTREYYETLANQRGANLEVLKPYLAQLEAVTAAQKRANASALDLDKAGTSRGASPWSRGLDGVGTSLGATPFRSAQEEVQLAASAIDKASVSAAGLNQRLSATGLTAKQTAAALRQVPAQFTDIVVSLQAGQNPLTVLLQQGGQLKDTFGGVGAAAGALGRYIVGLVNPFTAAAAAAAAVGYAFFRGEEEASDFNKALVLTGNQASLTVNRLTTLAERLDGLGTTQAAASSALLSFAGGAVQGEDRIARFTKAAIDFERVGGAAVTETAKAFAELGKNPLQAARKLDEATNFLTASQYEQIRAATEQGRTVEAARIAQDAYAASMESGTARIVQNLSSVERGWLDVKKAIAEVADNTLFSLFRQDSVIKQLADARSRLRNAQLTQERESANGGGGLLGRFIAGRAAEEERVQQERINSLNRTLLLESEMTAQQRLQIEQKDAMYAADSALAALGISRLSTAEREAQLVKTLRGGKVEDDLIAKAVQAFRSNSSKGSRTGKNADFLGLEVDMSAIERDLRQLTGVYADAESILAAQRQAGLVDEADYYEARRAFIRLNTEAQIRALQGENAAIQSSIDGGRLNADERTRQAEKIKDNLAQIQSLEARAAAQTLILGSQQTSAINSVSRAYQEARQSAEDYVDSLVQAQRRDIESIGLGDRARERLQGRQRIEDDYGRDRRRIENQRSLLEAQQDEPLSDSQKKRFDDQLSLVREFQTIALAEYEKGVDRRLAAEGRWEAGASRAINNYLEESRNVYKQTGDMVANAFRGAEDALVDFIKTGKLDFKSLADSIVADLARIIVKQQLSKAIGLLGGSEGIVGAAGSFVGALLGGAGTPPGRAIGGPVSAGQLYRVNERRPELLQVAGQQYLLMGNQGGQVKSEASSGPATVQTFHLSVNVPAGANRSTAQQTGREIARSLQVAMARGG